MSDDINPYELPAVEILWHDAHGGMLDDWGEITKGVHHRPEGVRTVGLLVIRDAVGATVVLSMTDAGESDAYLFVPNACIESIREL